MTGIAIIFGFLAASAALLAQVFISLIFNVSLTDSPSLVVLICAAAIEEGAKFSFFVQLRKRSPKGVSTPHALFFGAGFVSAEMALLFASATALPGILTLGTIAVLHIASTLILYSGFCLRESFRFSPLVALLGAILLHTLYNVSL